MSSEAPRHRYFRMGTMAVQSGAVQHKGITMKPLHAAIHAAKKVQAWGLYAAIRYALKNGATLPQFNSALTFEERRARRQRIRNSFAGYLA